MKRLLFIFTLLLSCSCLHAENVRVRLYSGNDISTLNVSFDLGNYNLYGNDALLEDMLGEGRSYATKARNCMSASTTTTTVFSTQYAS